MVTLRGSGVKGSAVYLDGSLLSDPQGVVMDLSRVPFSLVDEVVVYRGSSPVGYPEAGEGGVVDLRTMPVSSARRGRSRFSYDSFEGKEAAAAVSGKFLAGEAMLGVSADWGQAGFEFTDTQGTAADESDDRGERRTNNSYRDYDVLAKWERKSGGWRFYSGGFYQVNQRGLPGRDDQDARSASLDHDLLLAYLGAKRPAAVGADLDLELRLHGLWERYWFLDEEAELGPARHDMSGRSRLGVDGFFNYYGLNQNKISLYTGVCYDDYQPRGLRDDKVSSISARRSSAYVNASDEITLINNRLKVKPGVRYLWHENLYEGPTLTAELGRARESSHFSTTNVDLSVGLLLADNLWLLATTGQYYRPPDFLEQFGDRINRVGDPDLSPERSENWEVGLVYDLGPILEIDKFRAEINYHQTRRNKRIGWLEGEDELLFAENIGDARVNGLEFGAALNLRDRLLLTAAYTWQETDNLASDPELRHKQLPGAPRHAVSLTATLYQSYGRIYYKGHYQDTRFLDEPNTISSPARFTHDLGIGYYRGRWTISFEARNIANDRSPEVLGYPLPGASYLVLLEYQQ
jgi:outer membrane receptor protein involved in Fe transport